MKGYKGQVDEGGVRVPLFVRWSGHIEPIALSMDSLLTSILPTLADLCDTRSPFDSLRLDGLSLKASLLDEQTAPSDRMIFTHRYWANEVATSERCGQKPPLPLRPYCERRNPSLTWLKILARRKTSARSFPKQFQRHRAAYRNWFADVSKDWELESLIPCGYRQFPITHLHAVQSKLSGALQVSWQGISS